MNGLKLADMEASDMLDVLHYFFEEDLRYSTAEQADAVSGVRVSIYRNMYDTDYKYKSNSKNKNTRQYASDSDYENDLTPFDPSSAETKPYVPPTQLNDSGIDSSGILDGPLG